MEWKRVKTLLLILLLVCDLGLGISLGAQYMTQRQREEQALDDALDLLTQDGVLVEREQAALLQSSLPARLATRDTEFERTVLERLLGECTVTDQGGGVLVYQSPRGTVTVRSGGYVEGSCGPEGFLTSLEEALGVESVQRQKLDGLELYNTGIELENGQLTGRWILVPETGYLGAGGQRDRLLLDLAGFTGGDAEIRSLTQTWLVAGTAGRQCELEPVWRVETADSVRYMSLRTGRELAE